MDKELLEYCIQQRKEGVNTSQLKALLQDKGLNENAIKEILIEADNRYLYHIQKNATSRSFGLFRWLIAFFIAVASSVPVLVIMNYLHYIFLLFTPVFLAIAIVILVKQKRNSKKNLI